jgi:hypothetical protein
MHFWFSVDTYAERVNVCFLNEEDYIVGRFINLERPASMVKIAEELKKVIDKENEEYVLEKDYSRLFADDIVTRITICMPNSCEKKSYRTKEVYEVFNEYNKKYQQVFGSPKSKR